MAKKLEDTLKPKKDKGISTDEKIALDVATIAVNKPEALDTIKAAFGESKDPVLIVSSIIASVMEASVDQLDKRGIQLDPNVWLKDNGVVEQLIEEIDRLANLEGLDIPDDQKSAIFDGVVANLEQQFAAVQQGGAPQQPQQAGGPPPSGPPPVPMMGGM